MIAFNEIKVFITHMRLKYQVIILSGSYLAGGFFSAQANLELFILHYLVFVIIMNAAITVYNSFWDKDTGPVGGIYAPPNLSLWMLYASLLLKLTALLIAITTLGLFGGILYLTIIILSLLYSSPHIRWKNNPLLSLFIIFTGSGIISFLTGYLAYGNSNFNVTLISAALGTSFFVISLYPLSQSYQIPQDIKNKTISLAYVLKKKGNLIYYLITTAVGTILLGYSLTLNYPHLTYLFIFSNILLAFIIISQMNKLEFNTNDYKKVMNIKYFMGGLFGLVLLCMIAFY